MGVNLSPLQANDSQLQYLGNSVIFPDLKVHRFSVIEKPNAESLCKAVNLFLQENKQVVCVSCGTSELGKILKECKFVVVNGASLCLTKKPEGNGYIETRKVIDKYFSLCVLRQPVVCSRNHYLEHLHAQYWVSAKGDICPAGSANPKDWHSIGPLVISDAVCDEVKDLIDSSDRMAEVEIRSMQQAEHTRQVTITKRGNQGLMTVADGLKLGSKVFFQIFIKNLPKTALKTVPFVGLAVGLVFGTARAYKAFSGPETNWEEAAKAVAEVASGVLSLIPGYGVIGSVAIDGAIAAADLFRIFRPKKYQHESETEKFENAKRFFGIQEKPLTKQLVDEVYRNACKSAHPDTFIRLGGENVAELEKLQARINEAKSILYEHAKFK